MKRFLAALFLIPFFSCGIHFHGSGWPPSHEQWTILVKKHVSEAGLVDYKGFLKDSGALDGYLKLLSDNPPGEKWTTSDKIAYWLNAYNAFTVKLILKHYPLKSIKDLGGKHQIIFVNTPWDIRFFKIGGRTMTLNRIEHRILRHNFREPRIHFALNCASMSCPKLRREAYEGARLNEQLTDQAREFLRDKSKNELNGDKPKLSSIFDFYGMDMKKWSGQSLIGFIDQYSPVKIKEDADIDYLDYDWSLNEQK